MLQPVETADWMTLLGLLIFGVVCGLFTAAIVAARHGAGQELATDLSPEV